MFCNRTVNIPGSDTYPSVPVFNCLNINGTGICNNTGISIAEVLDLERWLNSLNKGTFKVTGSGVEGITIETSCSHFEFTSVTVTHTGGTVDIDFEEAEECTEENSCEPCQNECLKDLVGLRDVCIPKDSTNCVWIDEMGISRSFIEDVITKNYPSVSDFFDKQYTLALSEISNLIYNHFSPNYLVNSLVESKRLGFANENKSVKTSNSKPAGIQVSFLNSDSYIDFYLSELSLFTDHTGSVTIRVYDLLTSKEISSFNIDCIAGEQTTIYPNKIFKSNRKKLNLFFSYDSTGINSYTTVIKQNLCCGKTTCSNQYLEAGGGYSDANLFIDRDIKTIAHTFGMSLVYSLQCNHTDWICGHKNRLTMPIGYMLCSKISDFGLKASPNERVNNSVTINREELKANQEWYENKAISTLANILKNIRLPDDRKCFMCKPAGGTFVNLPG